MKLTYTPGPWKFQDEHVRDANGNILDEGPYAEYEANCRLMAAAPEVLEVARAMFREFAGQADRGASHETMDIINRAGRILSRLPRERSGK